MEQFSLAEYLKNPKREVVTRGGFKVEKIDKHYGIKENVWVWATVNFEDGEKRTFLYYPNGRMSYEQSSIFDLFFGPYPKEGYINLFRSEDDPSKIYPAGDIYPTMADAYDAGAESDKYVETCKIKYEG